MLKKKDPYITLLDFYYERFPEPITLQEVYELFHEKGYASKAELEIMKAFGKERSKKDTVVEQRASKKRWIFEKMFMQAGHSLSPSAGRNAPHVLNSEHYFHRLEYIELQEAKKSSNVAFILSIIAILISLSSLFLTWNSLNKAVNISQSQINQIVTAIQESK